MRLILLFFSLLTVQWVASQQPTSATEGSYTDEEGKFYWNKSKPIYLRISETPDGKGQLLKSETSKKFTNPLYLDTEGLNYFRTRYAVDPKTRKTAHPVQEVLWEIYADGTPPKAKLHFRNAKSFRTADKIYFGGGLLLDLEANDELSGVKESFISVNGADFQVYKEMIEVEGLGSFKIKYYAVDRVGNVAQVLEDDIEVDTENPVTVHQLDDKVLGDILSRHSRIKLSSNDSRSGVSNIFYRFDANGFHRLQGDHVSVGNLDDGVHTLEYYAIDNVGNQEPTKKYSFYVDKAPPITTADVLGDRFIVDDQVYFSGRTKLKLTAVDNKSGVDEIKYSINNQSFEPYQEPFYLPSVSGNHNVKFYSNDKLGNRSSGLRSNKFDQFEHNVSKIYVDLRGPKLSHSFRGKHLLLQDTVFVSPKTQIILKAVDDESGLRSLAYGMNRASDEMPYSGAIQIDKPGYHTIEIIGYDNVNNRNIVDFGVKVDATPPEIISNFSATALKKKEGMDVYPHFTQLYLAATDRQIGVEKIYYSLNNGKRKVYNQPIKGFRKNKKYDVEVVALDNLGNESSSKVQFYIE